MYRFLITALIAILSTLGTERFLNSIEPKTWLGSTLTTITGTTKVSDLDTILTANFNALNADKLEASSLYGSTTLPYITTLSGLASIGTITTGIWNGTGIDVARQGTGTTTLCLNNVILGNAGSGFKCADGHGVSGEFLTSNGAGTAPTWQASTVSLTADYTWTGEHSFTSATTTNFFANNWSLITGQTIATGSVVSLNSSGGITLAPGGWSQIGSTTLTSANATTTVTLTAQRNILKVIINVPGTTGGDIFPLIRFTNDAAGTNNYNFASGMCDGSASTAVNSSNRIELVTPGGTNNAPFIAIIDIIDFPISVKAVTGTFIKQLDASAANQTTYCTFSGKWIATTAQISSITLASNSSTLQYPAGTSITVYGSLQ